HGLKWVAVFVIPLGALWIGQTRTNMPEVDQQARMASDLPNSARAHWKYGFALQKADRLDEAAEQFRIALRLDPNEKQVHYHLGRALFVKGDFEGAKMHYLETARLDPKAPVHNALGVVYVRLGQTSEAIAQFKEALRLRPDDAEAAANLRFVLARDASGS